MRATLVKDTSCEDVFFRFSLRGTRSRPSWGRLLPKEKLLEWGKLDELWSEPITAWQIVKLFDPKSSKKTSE